MLANRKVSTIQSQIADILRTELIFGNYLPGEKLNEQDLAERFDVSRGPIREVLLILHKEGLIENKRNSGNFVCQPLQPSVENLMQGFKTNIEQFASNQFPTASKQQIASLERMLNQMDLHYKREEIVEFRAIEIEFQQVFIELSAGKDLANLWYLIAIRVNQGMSKNTPVDANIALHTHTLEQLKHPRQQNQ